MENYQELIGLLAMTMGVGWASGINLYAAILVLGLAGATGNLDLPTQLEVLQNPFVMIAAGIMYFVEFFADKVPGVDSGWDAIHTFIRIPAGALLAAGAVGDVSPALEIAAGLVGGGMAGTSHLTKSSARLLINTSPEPLTNWTASIAEDLAVLGGFWAMFNHPLLFLCFMVLFLLLVIWLLPKILKTVVKILRKVGSWLGLCSAEPAPSEMSVPPTSTVSTPLPQPAAATSQETGSGLRSGSGSNGNTLNS